MRFTLQFRIFTAFTLVFITLALLIANQYLLTKRLHSQEQFDTSVMQRDVVLGNELNKTNKQIILMLSTPTPKVTVYPVKKVVVTPVITK